MAGTPQGDWVWWAGEEGADVKAFMGINLSEVSGNLL